MSLETIISRDNRPPALKDRPIPEIYTDAGNNQVFLPDLNMERFIRAKLRPEIAYPYGSFVHYFGEDLSAHLGQEPFIQGRGLHENLDRLVDAGSSFTIDASHLKRIVDGQYGSAQTGGEGIVIPGTSHETGLPVAVKIFFRASTGFEVDRFIESSDVQNAVAHPEIPRVYGRTFLPMGDGEYAAALIMEMIPGATLSQLTPRFRDTDPRAALAVIEHLASTLDFIHAQNGLHLDIKPANIKAHLWGNTDKPRPRVVLLDFGLSRWQGSDTYTRHNAEPMHTIGYTPPELQTSHITRDPSLIGPWTDQYQLAMTAQQILLHTRLTRHFSQEISYRVLPDRIDKVIRQATAFKPEERFRNCRHFSQSLKVELHKAMVAQRLL